MLADDSSFLDVNLQPTTDYCYRVSTLFTDGSESAQSSQACATTLAAGAGGFQGYWKLDERGGTTAIDSSGLGRNGAITNATYSLQDRPNIDDDRSAISFSASTDSAITVPPALGFDLLGAFTVAFWAKLPAVSDVRFIGSRGAGCGALGWEIAQDAASGLHFAGQTQQVNAGASIPAGAWTHVAVTAEGGTMHLFLNGLEVGSGPFTADNTQQAPLSIGHVAGCSGGAVLMDDVQIQSRALSSAEIGVLGTLPPAPTNLVVASTTSATMHLSWDPVPGATAYIVSKGTGAGNEAFLTHSPAVPATFLADHLTPSTQYSWTVRAVVNHLFSNPSNEVIQTTDPAPAGSGQRDRDGDRARPDPGPVEPGDQRLQVLRVPVGQRRAVRVRGHRAGAGHGVPGGQSEPGDHVQLRDPGRGRHPDRRAAVTARQRDDAVTRRAAARPRPRRTRPRSAR